MKLEFKPWYGMKPTLPFVEYSKEYVRLNYDKLTKEQLKKLEVRNRWIVFNRSKGWLWEELADMFDLSITHIQSIVEKHAPALLGENSREAQIRNIKELDRILSDKKYLSWEEVINL